MSFCRSRNRLERSTPNGRHFGLRGRTLAQSASNALWECFNSKMIGYSTNTQLRQRFKRFADFIERDFGIKDLRDVTRAHVWAYSQKLRTSDKSASTQANYLSAVNSVMRQARGDNRCRVTAKEANLPSRHATDGTNKAQSEADFERLRHQLPQREFVIAQIQRQFGLRLEEACKLNVKQAYTEAQRHGFITVLYGTKGGKRRVVPIKKDAQIQTLKAAVEVQGSHYSLIPKEKSYKTYRSYYYRLAAKFGYRTHSQRHYFAQQLYRDLMMERFGIDCHAPVQHGLERYEYMKILKSVYGEMYGRFTTGYYDFVILHRAVRLEVAQQLGHERPQITNTYLY